MKTLILSLSILLLAACGQEPYPDVSCQGVLDGVEFTYTYRTQSAHWVFTTCSNDDPDSVVKESHAGFEGISMANHPSNLNYCAMEADYIIQYTGGPSASVKIPESRELVGEIPCQ